MIAFEVFVNGKKLATGGVGNNGVLSAIVNWVRRKTNSHFEEELKIHLGGLVSQEDGADEHLRWVENPLKPGDEVTIKVVQSDTVDLPVDSFKNNPAFEQEQERKYYEHLKSKYGD